MDSHDISLIIVIIVLVIMSGYFSATETSFMLLNRIRLKNMASNGDKRVGLVLKLSEEYDKLLSTILIGNNIVNIVMTTISTVLFVRFVGEVGPTVFEHSYDTCGFGIRRNFTQEPCKRSS